MKTSHIVSALPLCCLFLAAANQNDCNININVHQDPQGEGEGEGNGGEGEGQQGDCQSDADCGPGLICQFDCPPCAQPDPTDPNRPVCDVACPAEGKCVEAPPPPPPCVEDSDCGDGFFCAFECAQPGDSNGNDMPIACNTGVCEPIPPPPPPGDCNADSDCGPGAICETECTATDDGSSGNGAPPSDPNDPGSCKNVCVEIDPCFGQCDPSTSFCTILADGTATCEPYGTSCMSDSDCQNGQVCDATTNCAPDPGCTDPNGNCVAVCTGVCIDPPPASCNADSDCSAGQVCVQACPETPIACQPDANGNCEPPPPCQGVCVTQDPPPPPTECNSDADCAQGDKCIQTEECAPCDPTTGQACSDVCQIVSICVAPDGSPQP